MKNLWKYILHTVHIYYIKLHKYFDRSSLWWLKPFCDSYFITCDLVDTLLTQDMYASSTTQPLRNGFPETLKSVTLEQGEHLFCQRGNRVGSVWMDKTSVNMLSTLAQADVTHTAQRKQKDGSRVSVQYNDTVILYNKYMAGVDKGDQMWQYYPVVRTKCHFCLM